MSKRRNENGQMRREEYEAADDRDSDAGGDAGGADGSFQRASEAALSRRKIVTARVAKRPAAATPAPAPAAAPAPAPAKANPFSGFSGLASTSSSEPPARANPFSGFSGLTSAAPTQPATASFTNGTSGTAATKSSPKTYQEAIEVLNKEFLDFVSEQLRKNPSSDWTAALKDYLKHAEEIATKFASTKPVASSASFASPPPAGATSKIPSFLSAPSQSAKKDDSASKSTASSGFSFGAKDTPAPAPASTSSSGFSFGSTPSPKPPVSGGFSFGSSSSPNEKEPSTKSSGFSFGAKPVDSKPAPAATPAFSFGAAKPAESTADDKPKPASSSGFSFGAAPAAPPSTGGFSFSLSKPAAAAAPATTAPASGGFSFALPTAPATSAAPFSFGGASTAVAPAASAAGATAEDDDDENIGREEATVILKADNPDEDCVFETDKAKILEFKKDEKRWADKGTHPLKVLINKETKAARILVRNQIGKIVLNSSLYKGLAVKPQETKGKKTGALLSLQVDASLTQFILKVNGEKVDAFLSAIEKATPQ